MPQPDSRSGTVGDAGMTAVLQRAHEDAMAQFDDHEESEPYGETGITNIDGRKRFVRGFKQVADRVGAQRYEHTDPRLPLTLIYDRGDASYRLQHRTVDTAQSISKKTPAYQAMLVAIAEADYANEARVYSLLE